MCNKYDVEAIKKALNFNQLVDIEINSDYQALAWISFLQRNYAKYHLYSFEEVRQEFLNITEEQAELLQLVNFNKTLIVSKSSNAFVLLKDLHSKGFVGVDNYALANVGAANVCFARLD